MMSELSIAKSNIFFPKKNTDALCGSEEAVSVFFFYSFGNLLPMPGSLILLFSAVLLKL